MITVDTNQPLNPSRIVVGMASDLALQVRCTTTSTNPISWTKDGSTVSEGLNPFGISQEDGVLRVYPVTLLSEGDTTFSCSDDSDSLDVLFDRRKCNAELIRKIAVLRCGKLTDHRIINTLLPNWVHDWKWAITSFGFCLYTQVRISSLPHQYQSKLQQRLMSSLSALSPISLLPR